MKKDINILQSALISYMGNTMLGQETLNKPYQEGNSLYDPTLSSTERKIWQ